MLTQSRRYTYLYETISEMLIRLGWISIRVTYAFHDWQRSDRILRLHRCNNITYGACLFLAETDKVWVIAPHHDAAALEQFLLSLSN